jgi:hypothetical protein
MHLLLDTSAAWRQPAVSENAIRTGRVRKRPA